MGVPGGQVQVDWQRILDLATASTNTINTIDSATEALTTHIADLTSGMVGFGQDIPARMKRWQQALSEVSGDLSSTKTQLEAIAARARHMIAIANGGNGQ